MADALGRALHEMCEIVQNALDSRRWLGRG
jgi:hypothetical protein